jgi:molybdate transport system ATP-binding protein
VLTCDIRVEFRDEVVTSNFATDEGITVLFGASGAGKSVTLKALAGLLRPAAGRIRFDDTVFFDSETSTSLPPGRRRVGYVPQSLGIFPNMTVTDNIGFGAEGSRSEQNARIARLIALMGLQGLERRKPKALSGGQQQRVALARALARDARLLLLDEPFSALDEGLRQEMRHELLRLREELSLTIIFVTHDLREAHLLADRIAVLDRGKVLQFDCREAVFRRPVNRRVAELTGVANIFDGEITRLHEESVDVSVGGLVLRCDSRAQDAFTVGQRVDVAIRAERVNLRRREASQIAGTNALEATVTSELSYGSTHTLHLQPLGAGPPLQVELAARPYEVLDVANRRRWTLELPPGDLHVMPQKVTSSPGDTEEPRPGRVSRH